jgi:hypothetical protein
MTEERRIGDSSLIDLLDRLLETGVVATGDVLLGLADVDLIRVNLQLVLGAVDTLMADDDSAAQDSRIERPTSAAHLKQLDAPRVAQHAEQHHESNPAHHAAPRGAQPPAVAPATRPTAAALQLDDPDRADLGVGGLLVAVVEIVHRLLERQAIHRMERGSLTSEQTERLGQALMALDQRINQLIEIFGVRSSSALPATVAGTAH